MKINRWTTRTIRALGWGLAAAALGCATKLDITSIPDDATLDLAFSTGARTVMANHSTRIEGILRFSTGDLAGAGWTLDLSVSNGGLQSGADTAAMIPALRLVTDHVGLVTANFTAPADSGSVVVTLSGGGRAIVDTLRIIPDTAMKQ